MKKNLGLIGLLQAAGLVSYCSFVAWIMFNAQHWFGKPESFLGPLLFLSLFVVSAGICGLILGGYAFTLVWEEKKTKDAIKLCAYTLSWLVGFVFVLLLTQILF